MVICISATILAQEKDFRQWPGLACGLCAVHGSKIGVKTKQLTLDSNRTLWKQTERQVKREGLDVIASICGTDRNTVGKVVASVTTTDGYESYENDNDERTTEQYDERASSSASTEHS